MAAYDIGQVACVNIGHSEVQVQFCYLAMSGVVHGLRKSQQAVDIYPIVNDNDEGHVAYDQTSRDFSVEARVITTKIVMT